MKQILKAIADKARAFLGTLPARLSKLDPYTRLLVIAVVAVLLALVLGFLWGRHSAPALVTRDAKSAEHVETQSKSTATSKIEQKTEATKAVQTEQAKQTDKVRTVVVYRDRVIKPDGTQIEHERIQSRTDSSQSAQTSQRSDLTVATQTAAETVANASTTQTATRTSETHEQIDRRDRLLLQGMAGLGVTGPVYGAAVSYRLAGPLYVGAWGLTVPAGGVSVGFGF